MWIKTYLKGYKMEQRKIEDYYYFFTGEPGNIIPAEVVELVLEYRSNGKSPEEIAKLIGHPTIAVEGVIKDYEK